MCLQIVSKSLHGQHPSLHGSDLELRPEHGGGSQGSGLVESGISSQVLLNIIVPGPQVTLQGC